MDVALHAFSVYANETSRPQISHRANPETCTTSDEHVVFGTSGKQSLILEKSILFVPQFFAESRFGPSTSKPDNLHP